MNQNQQQFRQADQQDLARLQQLLQRIQQIKDQIQFNNSQGNQHANQSLALELQQLSARAHQFMSKNRSQMQYQNQPPPQSPQSSGSPMQPVQPQLQQSNLQPQSQAQNDLQKKKKNAQVQTDLFLKTLFDYYKANGTGISPNDLSVPIEGKQVNPFILYMLVRSLNGFQTVSNNNQWEVIATKMGLMPPNHPNSAAVVSQLFSYYQKYLVQFELYLRTPEGQRQLEMNKNQKIMEMKQQQQPPQQQSPQNHHQSQLNSPMVPQPQLNSQTMSQQMPQTQMANQMSNQMSNQVPNQLTNQLTNKVPNQMPNQMHNQMPNQMSNQINNQMPSSLSQHNTPKMPEQPELQPYNGSDKPQTPRMTPSSTKPSSAASSVHARAASETSEQSNTDPTYYRVYEPLKRPTNNYVAGIPVSFIKDTTGVSEQLEKLKPNYLYPPEIGQINVHALMMSLQSHNISEINNVLNMILVVTSDQKMEFNVNECQEIVDKLSEVGISLLDELVYNTLDQKDLPQNETIYVERKKASKSKSGKIEKTTPLRKRKLFKPKSFDVKHIEHLTPYDKFYSDKIDDLLLQHLKNSNDGENVIVTVDSFTGEEVDQSELELSEVSDQDSISQVFSDPELLDPANVFVTPKVFKENQKREKIFKIDQKDEYKDNFFASKVSKIGLPVYMDLLKKCNEEMSELFNDINVRASENYQVMLIDLLGTLSMISRNLTFSPSNLRFLVTSAIFKRFLFKLIFTCFAFDEYFLYSRRKLGILKDCLVTLVNMGNYIKLSDFHEALIIVMLTLEFGGELSKAKSKSDVSLMGEYSPVIQKYQGHAVDMFAKVMANCKENRYLIKCVLTGRYEKYTRFNTKTYYNKDKKIEDNVEENNDFIDDKNFYTNLGFDADEDVLHDPVTYTYSKYLIKSLGVDELPESCYLLRRMFGFMMAVIPTHSTDTSRFEERAAVIIQALLSSNLIVKLIPTDPSVSKNIALEWISSYESVGANLLRIGFILTSMRRHSGNRLFPFIASKSLTTMNSLLSKLFNYLDMQIAQGIDVSNDLKALAQLPRIFPAHDTILGSFLLTPGTDQSLLKEVLELGKYSNRVSKFLQEHQKISANQ